jgi:hypothetical protein
MALFGDCPVCPEKDRHAAFLESQVRELQAKLLELAAPGAVARMAWTQQAQRDKKPTMPSSYSPSRLAQIRKDLPTARESQAPAVMPQDIEASFKR